MSNIFQLMTPLINCPEPLETLYRKIVQTLSLLHCCCCNFQHFSLKVKRLFEELDQHHKHLIHIKIILFEYVLDLYEFSQAVKELVNKR